MKTKGLCSRRQFFADGLKLGASAVAVSTLASSVAAGQEVPAASPWRIGCYTRPWDQYDYRQGLDAIAEAGFKYAGLMTTKSDTHLVISVQTTPDEALKIGEECTQRGLSVPSVYGGGIPVSESLEKGIEGLKRLIDNCVAAKVENLMMGGIGEEALYAVYYDAIAKCCDYAAEKNVGISVKPHGGLNATGPQCRKTIEMVGHKNFKICYDPGNIFYYSDGALNPVDDAATVDGLVVGMCVKDYLPAKDDKPKDVALTPGTGLVDFAKVLARLKQGGFTSGALVVECLTPGDLPAMLAEAKKAREFVEGLVKQLG